MDIATKPADSQPISGTVASRTYAERRLRPIVRVQHAQQPRVNTAIKRLGTCALAGLRALRRHVASVQSMKHMRTTQIHHDCM